MVEGAVIGEPVDEPVVVETPGKVEAQDRMVEEQTVDEAVKESVLVEMNISESEHIKDAPIYPIKPIVWLVAFLASFGGLCFGWDIGGSGGTFVMNYFRVYMGWGDVPPSGTSQASYINVQEGAITYTMPMGAFVGSLPTGWISDTIGRRWSLILGAGIFCVGAFIQMFTVGFDMLLAGRVVSGIGIGMMSTLVNMYTSETSPVRIRGTLLTFFQLCITFGILLAAACNVGLQYWSLGWRASYGGNVVFGLTLFFGMFFCPETPRFLVSKDRLEEARASLLRTRQPEEVEPEMEELIRSEEMLRSASKGTWCGLFNGPFRQGYRTSLGMLAQFFQQLTGINAIMYFAPSMFSTFFSATGALISNLALNTVNFISTFLCIWLVDKYGRTKLLIIGGVGMVVFTLGVCLFAIPYGVTPEQPLAPYQTDLGVGIGIIVCCMLYDVFFAASWGPIIWIVCAEIHNNTYRGKGMSMSTATNWIFNSVIGYATPFLYQPDVFNLWGTFLMFCLFNVALTIWVWCCVPETMGIPLEEMDAMFMWYRPSWRRKTYPGKEAVAFLEEEMESQKVVV